MRDAQRIANAHGRARARSNFGTNLPKGRPAIFQSLSGRCKSLCKSHWSASCCAVAGRTARRGSEISCENGHILVEALYR